MMRSTHHLTAMTLGLKRSSKLMTQYSTVHSAPSETTNHRFSPEPQQGFSHFVAICFTVNYLIGTGFLTIPWAFERGGIVLSLITLMMVAAVSNITKNYLLSAMALAEALTASSEIESDSSSNGSVVSLTQKNGTDYGSADEVGLHVDAGKGLAPVDEEESNGNTSSYMHEHHPVSLAMDTAGKVQPKEMHHTGAAIVYTEEVAFVRERKFEVIDLCRMYLGELGEKVLIFSVALDVYFELWAFVSVFASSLARQLPLAKNFDQDYHLYAFMFAAVVVPLACLELREQVEFQITLSACRILVIIIMIMTTYAAMKNDKNGGMEVYFTGVEGTQGAPLVHFGGFYAMFSVMFYTTQFHLSIPVVSQAVRDKRQLGGIFRDALALVTAALSLLGVFVAWYFGDLVEQSANLNWSTFVGGIQEGSEEAPFWARSISLFALCFPALNVLSAYPINAILLGNNLMAITYGTNDTDHRSNRLIRALFRILASVPPIIGALFVKDLGIITDYAGLFGAVSALPFPAVVFWMSRRMATERGIQKATHYDSFGSSEPFAIGIFSFSMIALLYILMSLVLS